ncbi:Eukaryotic translation initiation factor 2 like protein [Argiope bruennichi]|uniref:Eukaryotic translation initiation factor 2 subunit 2 n=1 Tax=Argiope bruennichi TaxID=94029 RepID=A0A8T0FHT3_ARGBR|nr:Eukaryotic translation initiation factor 2 like protein [Argiope bruennichi]
MKKKKKKKKMPFDPSALEDNSTANEAGEFQQDDDTENIKDDVDGVDDKEDAVLDLDDFSGLKKKKKKKKPFNLEELDSNIPESEPKDETSAVLTDDKDADDIILDDDLDFSLPKKKKKKKKINIDELESEFGVAEDDEDDDTKFVEEDAEPKITTSVSSSSWLGTDRDYTYDELFLRVLTLKAKKKIRGVGGSVDANNQLIIKGRFQQKQIENVLRRYIKEYVTCHTCRSPDTILQKDTRLFFLQCETCGSRCSVASIKSGFQAVTGKRAAIRAKTA